MGHPWYKISNELLQLESFHGRSEQAVNQELYAHFTLIAMARLFASRDERHFESRDEEADRAPLRANFNQSLGGGGAGTRRALAAGTAAARRAEQGAGARGTESPAGAARPLLPAPVPPPEHEMEESQARRPPDRRLNRIPS